MPTFSNPKNLSLPSFRTGPVTSANSFSSGVIMGALGSFLTGAFPAAGLEGLWKGFTVRREIFFLSGCMAYDGYRYRYRYRYILRCL